MTKTVVIYSYISKHSRLLPPRPLGGEGMTLRLEDKPLHLVAHPLLPPRPLGGEGWGEGEEDWGEGEEK